MKLWLFISVLIIDLISLASNKTNEYDGTDIQRFTFYSIPDTLSANIKKLWPPLDTDNTKATELAEYTHISSVLQRHDTLLVLTNTPKIFYNDYYTFNFKDEFIDAFPNGKVKFLYCPDSAPNYVVVESTYGDFKDSLSYIGQDPLYSIDSGRLVTNRLFSISKHCKIGTPINEFFEYLGLDLLGIPAINEGFIILNPYLKEINSPDISKIYSNYVVDRQRWIVLEITSGRINSIEFGVGLEEIIVNFENKYGFPFDN